MSKPKTLQVITDISDASFNEMFGVMDSMARALSDQPLTIAPVAAAKELSIVHGAFLTRLLAKSYTAPTVLFTNVAPHPVYKSDIIGKLKGRDVIFIGSNNGVCDWLARDFGFEYITEVTVKKPFIVNGETVYLPGETPPADYEKRFAGKSEHLTFSAHVIYGSIAVALAYGVDHTHFGEARNKDFIVPLEITDGEVVHIDNFGMAKIYGTLPSKPGEKVDILKDGQKIAQAEYINDRMMSHPTNSYVMYPSTSLAGLVDLALVRGNASKQLNLNIGDTLSFQTAKS